MTDSPPPTDDDRDTDQSDQPRSEDSLSRRGGVSGLLRQLLETIQRLDESGRSVERGQGRRRSGNTAFEYEYSVNMGLGEAETADSAAATEPNHPVSVQETLDGASVTVDLPAVDPETLRAGVDGRRLVVAADDERLARVTLPEDNYTVRTATYNNGVLEIRLEDSDSEVTFDD
jgi:HSP20 family molecular chaperone IbpA